MTVLPETVQWRDGRPGEVLNLCFHGIGTPGRELEPDEENFWVEPAQFKEILDVIVRYPAVRITFDDGNMSDVELALPELRRRNLTAVFFVVSGRLGQPGSLAAADLRNLLQSGMTIGSHGMMHRPWRTASAQELHEELTGAQEAIAQASGQPVSQVACPFGSYDRRVLNAIRHRGFSRVYTVDGGPARSDAWLQSRYTVRAYDMPRDIERRAQSPRGKTLAHAVQVSKSLVKRWR
jgi:peptidoglycan/xylan/chitin deacetylase (PgdA/CDA1 family)